MPHMPKDDKTTCKLLAVEDAQAIHGSSGQRISHKPGAFLLVAAAYILGGGGMLAWLAFLLMGPLWALDFGLGTAAGLLVDTLLCLMFFVQHSTMVRRRFRLRLIRTVRADFHGALYASASGSCLLMLTVLWQPVGSVPWSLPDPVRWVMLLFFLAAGVGALWGTRSLGDFDALGVRSAMQAVDHRPPVKSAPLIIRGPYRWVRHPLYFFSLIIIWTGPVFTADRLLHNLLWTVWIAIGATMEERDLVGCFGEAYRSYQKSVPMLLPTSLKPLTTGSRGNPESYH